MKKALALLLVLAMVLTALCGCAKSEPDAKTETKSETKSEGETVATEKLESCKLNWLSWMTKGEDEPTINDFMALHPEVEVEVRAIDGTNYASDLLTLCMGGDVPDVFLCQSNAINDLVANGYIQPIDGLKGVDKQQANEGIQSLLSRDGKTYAYAINGGKGSKFVYYNKAMFEAAGCEVPTTFEEFEAVCAKLKDAGYDALITPAGDTWNANYFACSYMNKVIGDKGSPEQAELALLKGEMKVSDLYGDVFRTMKKFYENGWISEGGLSMGWETATQFFVDEGAAMICTGNWLPGSTPIGENPDFEYGCFLLPGIPSDSNGKCWDAASTDRVIALSANPANYDAAVALLEYFISDDVLSAYLTRQGLMGVNIDVPVAEVFEDAMAVAGSDSYFLSPTIGLPDMPAGWTPNVSQYSADVFTSASVDELLDKLDADYDAAMSTVDVDSFIKTIEAKLG